jgi:hypothetical protein
MTCIIYSSHLVTDAYDMVRLLVTDAYDMVRLLVTDAYDSVRLLVTDAYDRVRLLVTDAYDSLPGLHVYHLLAWDLGDQQNPLPKFILKSHKMDPRLIYTVKGLNSYILLYSL